MSDNEYAIKYLKAIEKKHKDYFENSKLRITNCVVLKGKENLSAHVINPNLPFEIMHDIEMMFWVE
jgi:maleate cis-trans isomerase